MPWSTCGAEGYRDDQIHLVGNVMVDSLLANIDRARQRPTLAALGLEPGGFGLITLHRPANVDDPEMLGRLMGALARIGEELPLLFPVHPRTRQRLAGLGPTPGVRLVEPAGYLDFLAMETGARLVLTDSGGIEQDLRPRRAVPHPARQHRASRHGDCSMGGTPLNKPLVGHIASVSGVV